MARSKDFDSSGQELRRRLAELNKKYSASGKPAVMTADALQSKQSKPVPVTRKRKPTSQNEATPPVPKSPIIYYRDLPRTDTGPAVEQQIAHVTLEETEGEEWVHPQWGKAFVVQTPSNGLDGAQDLARRFEDKIDSKAAPILDQLKARTELDDVGVEDFIFMDIETTGLGTSPVFEIGIMIWKDGQFEVQQFLARNYAEERAILAFFVDACKARKLLVTFNGKSFDFPFLRTRCAATGVPFGLSPAHLDLLHVGRSIWKEILPNCKLQTLERYVCGRIRQGDIPGSEIPDAYHAYVRSKNAYQMLEVLKHNLLDLITLADIMTHLPPMPKKKPRKRRRRK